MSVVSAAPKAAKAIPLDNSVSLPDSRSLPDSVQFVAEQREAAPPPIFNGPMKFRFQKSADARSDAQELATKKAVHDKALKELFAKNPVLKKVHDHEDVAIWVVDRISDFTPAVLRDQAGSARTFMHDRKPRTIIFFSKSSLEVSPAAVVGNISMELHRAAFQRRQPGYPHGLESVLEKNVEDMKAVMKQWKTDLGEDHADVKEMELLLKTRGAALKRMQENRKKAEERRKKRPQGPRRPLDPSKVA